MVCLPFFKAGYSVFLVFLNKTSFPFGVYIRQMLLFRAGAAHHEKEQQKCAGQADA